MGNNLPAMKCARSLIFALNVIFLIVATILLALGVGFYKSYAGLEYFLETPYFGPAAIVITVALILLFVSLLGYVSAMKESVCLVNTYSFLLTILLIFELAAAITALIISNKAFGAIQNTMKGSLSLYNTNDIVQRAWDVTQQDLYCCGITQPFDWSTHNVNGTSLENGGTIYRVPFSCCVEPTNCASGKIYSVGCWNILKSKLSGAARVLGYSVLNIAILQLIGIVFSAMLAKYLRRAKTLEEMNRQATLSSVYKDRKIKLAKPGDNSACSEA